MCSVLHYGTSVEMHVFWLNGFLCVVMGKLVNIEKRLDSHQRYKSPWFHILHSSIILCSLVAILVLDVVKFVWFCCEHSLETVGDLVCEGTLSDFVVYYPTFFTGRGN